MALPRALGGPQLTPVEQFQVLEAFSLADASVGWCAMIGADSGFIPGFLDDATLAEVFPTRNLVTAGKVMPSGRAIRCPEAAARSARAFFVAEIERVWAACVDDGDLSRSVTAPLRLAMVHASTVAVDVTRAMFGLLTTTSIATGSVFAQLVADAAVANTHVATGHRNWAPLGARLAGRKVPAATVFI